MAVTMGTPDDRARGVEIESENLRNQKALELRAKEHKLDGDRWCSARASWLTGTPALTLTIRRAAVTLARRVAAADVPAAELQRVGALGGRVDRPSNATAPHPNRRLQAGPRPPWPAAAGRNTASRPDNRRRGAPRGPGRWPAGRQPQRERRKSGAERLQVPSGRLW